MGQLCLDQSCLGQPALAAPAGDDEFVKLLARVATGDEAPILVICNRYRPRLCRLIRKWKGDRISPAFDDEDLAQEVLHSIFEKLQAGNFAQITTERGFWRLIRQRADWNLSMRRRHHCRQKRGGEWRLMQAGFDLNSIPAPPAPEFDDADHEAEFYGFLYTEYGREPLFWLLYEMQLQGASLEELATALNISKRVVYSKLRLRQKKWEAYQDLEVAAKRSRKAKEDRRRWKATAQAFVDHQRELAERGKTARHAGH